MFLRMILYVMVGYFIYRVVQLAGRLMSPGRRPGGGSKTEHPEPNIPDFRDIKDADFIDITPKDKGADTPKSS